MIKQNLESSVSEFSLEQENVWLTPDNSSIPANKLSGMKMTNLLNGNTWISFLFPQLDVDLIEVKVINFILNSRINNSLVYVLSGATFT